MSIALQAIIAVAAVLTLLLGFWKVNAASKKELQETMADNHKESTDKLVKLQIELAQHTTDEKNRDEKLERLMSKLDRQDERLGVVERGGLFLEIVRHAKTMLGDKE